MRTLTFLLRCATTALLMATAIGVANAKTPQLRGDSSSLTTADILAEQFDWLDDHDPHFADRMLVAPATVEYDAEPATVRADDRCNCTVAPDQ